MPELGMFRGMDAIIRSVQRDECQNQVCSEGWMPESGLFRGMDGRIRSVQRDGWQNQVCSEGWMPELDVFRGIEPELGLFRGMDARLRSVQRDGWQNQVCSTEKHAEVVWTSISDFGLILERTIEPCKAGQTEDGVVALKQKSK